MIAIVRLMQATMKQPEPNVAPLIFMLSLTRIFLHNWHRFTHHIIDVEDSLYLAGHNGSGKSSVLDALQVVLIADRRVRFNSSAQERSGQRTLDTYVRGKLGENKWLRPGATIGYIALEFRNAADHTACTVGVCIEAGNGQADRTFFIVPDALDVALFIHDGRPRTRRHLREAIKNRRGARSFEQVGEYQDQLLNRLGGLNQRFFDLFLKALTFQPIRNIREFVEQWLLEEQSLDLDTLRLVKERLTDLRRHAAETQIKLAALRTIVEQQQGQRRQRHLADTYAVLLALLHEAAATERVADLHAEIESLVQQRSEADAARAGAEAAYNGAQAAYIKARVDLQQLDVVRRRDELQTQIARLTSEADAIRQRWHKLRSALHDEAQTLQPFVALAPFAPAERTAVDDLLRLIANLADTPPSALAAALDAAVPALDAATEQARQQSFDLNRQLQELHDRRRTLQAELTRLLDPRSRPTYPKNVEWLRDLLTPVVGERPRLLCELLDVPDARWQDAVEAMLGGRRFNVIVPPHTFAAALRELNRARAVERLYDVGLLDLDKARTEARPPRPNSLANKVHTPSKPIRAYIDTVLGDIITCESVDELRTHRRAVTPDVVVYGEWTARAVPPNRYRPWQIGQGARQSQIEALQHEIAAIDHHIAERTPERANRRALVGGLDRKAALLLYRRELDLPLDDAPLRAEIVEAERDLQALDWSGVAALEGEVDRLKQITDEERADADRLTGRLAELRATLHARNEALHTAQRELAERTMQAQAVRERLPHAVPDAEDELRKRLAQGEWNTTIANAEAKAKEFDTKANNALQTLIGLGTDYNTRYQFAALPANPAEERYAAEEQRLGETDLPRYADHIAQAEREAEEELREHVLHRLREQIVGARQQLDRINDALRDTPFHGERYSFRCEPDNQLRPFYDLINEAQALGTTALHESEFYARHRAAFDQFYDALTHTPRADDERREQERLTDYRRYLSYDIEVRHRDGTVSRLSKLMGHTSGGETQTPFYVTIAASFVQLYRVGERTGQATTRLVAFDEAFSKMDQDRIGATLDLFQHFKLQIITATPLERCEYLVPKMCTSLVLTGVADQVLIEPYRNYAARLDGFDGA